MNAPHMMSVVGSHSDPPLPANVEAENAVLGSILGDNRVYSEISGILSQDDFSDGSSKELYGLIASMISAGRSADWITVKTAFQAHPSLKEIDAGKYLAMLAAASRGSIVAPEYARIVRDMSARRRIIEAARSAISSAMDMGSEADDWSSIAGRIKADMDSVIRNTADDEIVTHRQVLNELGRRLDEPVAPIRTSLLHLDRSFGGGLYRKCVYGFEGRMKRFKTGILAAVFGGTWKSGSRAAFVTLEMGPVDIVQREIAGYAGINFREFGSRSKADTSARAILEQERIHGDRMDAAFYAHVPGVTADKLMSIMARLVEVHRCDVIILDYWQRVRGKTSSESKSEFLESVSARIADFASVANIAVVMASQLNRQDESLGSDGLARDCSWCATINKVEVQNGDPNNPDAEFWLDVTENRHGPGGTVGDEDYRAFRIAPGPVLQEINHGHV